MTLRPTTWKQFCDWFWSFFSYIWYLYSKNREKSVILVSTKAYDPVFKLTPLLEQELVVLASHSNQFLLKNICGIYPREHKSCNYGYCGKSLLMPYWCSHSIVVLEDSMNHSQAITQLMMQLLFITLRILQRSINQLLKGPQ